MKQNKNSSVVYRVASATLAAVFLLFSFVLPSFADSSNQFNDGCIVPYSSNYSNSSSSNYQFWNNGLNIGYSVDGSTTTSVNAICNINNVDIYFFRVVVNGSNTQTCSVYHGSGSATVGYRWMRSGSSVNSITCSLYTSNGITSADQIYAGYRNNSFPSSWNSDIPVFSSFDDGVLAFKQFVDNGFSYAAAEPITYEIPAGYVAFFDIHGLSHIQGSVLASSGIPLTPSEWSSTNILYGYSSSIPASFSLPLSGSTSFSWRTGKTNIYGKSQSWSWLGTFAGGSNYLFVSNPTYSNVMGVQSNGTSMILDNPSATNSYVTVYLSQAYSVKLVSLNALISYDPSNGNYGGVDDGSGDSSYSVEYDPDTGTWITKDDSTGLPVGVDGIPVGGDNSIDIPSEFSTITAWLENIANTIGAFFRGAIGAVSTLVSAGSAFINQLISLYSWLPAPVYSVLSSALVLVITIGVIKVFI